jgi:hypothetical protein
MLNYSVGKLINCVTLLGKLNADNSPHSVVNEAQWGYGIMWNHPDWGYASLQIETSTSVKDLACRVYDRPMGLSLYSTLILNCYDEH